MGFNRFRNGHGRRHLMASALALAACPAHAQEQPAQSSSAQGSDAAAHNTDPSGLADIVVTAERRSASLQATPISISAVTGDAMQERQIVNLEGLSTQVPNVEFGRNAGDAKVYIRGVGYDSIAPGGETRVAIYSDSIYQSRTQAGFAGFYDVERVEILRGPQGTLYGRNATAGAVNILTREPSSTLDGYASLRAGNYGLIGTEGAVGGALTETLSGRIAFQTSDRNGYGRHIITGEDVNNERTRSARLKLRFAPSSAFSYRIVADYTKERDNSGGYRYLGQGRPDVVPLGIRLGGPPPANPQDAAGFGPRLFLETYGFSGEGKIAIGPSTDLVSLTGYRHLLAQNQSSTDASPAMVSQQYLTDRSNSFSQELRLSHQLGSLADILIGGYYFHEKSFAGNRIPFSGAAVGLPNPDYIQGFESQGRVKTKAFAIFGQARINLLSDLTLTLGGRYSNEKKTIDEGLQLDFVTAYRPENPFTPIATQRASTTESRFDPRVTVDFKPSNTVFLYATYSRGFKSGGFNIGGIQPAFLPEVLEDYEIGTKLDLLDRRLRINLAAFHYDYSNLQVNIVEGVTLVTRNAASAKVDGIELEATALPTDALRISINASYLNARYTRFLDTNPAFPELGQQDLSGNRLNYSPRWKVNGEVGYAFDSSFGTITPRVNVTWVDRLYFSQFNQSTTSQPSRTNIDAYINFESADGLWSASAFAKNLTDRTYIVSASISNVLFGFPVLGQYGAPRTYGLSVTRRF